MEKKQIIIPFKCFYFMPKSKSWDFNFHYNFLVHNDFFPLIKCANIKDNNLIIKMPDKSINDKNSYNLVTFHLFQFLNTEGQKADFTFLGSPFSSNIYNFSFNTKFPPAVGSSTNGYINAKLKQVKLCAYCNFDTLEVHNQPTSKNFKLWCINDFIKTIKLFPNLKHISFGALKSLSLKNLMIDCKTIRFNVYKLSLPSLEKLDLSSCENLILYIRPEKLAALPHNSTVFNQNINYKAKLHFSNKLKISVHFMENYHEYETTLVCDKFFNFKSSTKKVVSIATIFKTLSQQINKLPKKVYTFPNDSIENN